jgi:hypothetical protein
MPIGTTIVGGAARLAARVESRQPVLGGWPWALGALALGVVWRRRGG